MKPNSSNVIMFFSTMGALLATSTAFGSFTTYTNFDQWKAANGSNYTTMNFVFSQPVLLTTQYLPLGVTFPDAEEVAAPLGVAFPIDGWGVWGSGSGDGDVHLKFLTPQKWIGAHYPANLLYQLLSGGNVIYTSPTHGGFGPGLFYGVVSDQMFDEVKIINQSGLLYIDNIYFGVPAPGAVSVFGLWFVRGRRRR